LGVHEGGHTPYWFDISSNLRPGDNFLAVELDRPTAQTIPGLALRLREGHRIGYDWWHYGGLVRDVWLTINQDGLIRRQRITSTVTGQKVQVRSTAFLDNISQGKNGFRVIATIYSPGGEVVGKPETVSSGRWGSSLAASTPSEGSAWLIFKLLVPEILLRVWVGHSTDDITDRYALDGVKRDTLFRTITAQKAGLGFKLWQRDCELHPVEPHEQSVSVNRWSGREDLNLRPPGLEILGIGQVHSC
jgi:hypothetical protein